ncbi:LysR family transcriptional regulator (chromosome initiation inhibitor) [Pseudoduganella lurida]|uniref:LysR family transcriptional regulator (Chromosome initiation inhibitor) n=1 Tax=Pseudoduganella lurida TaxID=1036180 RepID=A0A562RLY3_9BURK|nr:LysR family transcriptional regulator ArgP [Pseudoduganella lurida]TWI69903.1 LysR family transcriptional regulator (chromosome initiation inhibitor) [Pseudoduganella lurida]
MGLDARQCDAFLATAETGSFDTAALQLRITPSAVSQRIAGLEMALGAPLLVRSRPCRPTATGQRLLVYLRRTRLLEQEFQADLRTDQSGPLQIPVAVNNDTLATWLLPAIAPFLAAQRMTLDIVLDEQNYTYALLEKGLAVAGISSAATAMRGCTVAPLGFMRYRMVGSPQFVQRWFSAGFNREAAIRAPVLVFSRKDTLQADFLLKELGLMAGAYPVHYLPASDPFLQAARLGIGYGMLPSQQCDALVETGELVDVAPGRFTDVPLFWHAWRVQSHALELLGREVITAAASLLQQA